MRHAPAHRAAPRALLALVLLLPLLPGCGMFGGWFAHGLFGDQADPVYQPEDRQTLVLVDQGNERNPMPLGDPTLTDAIASSIAYHLDQEHVIRKLVEQKQVSDLRKELGDDKFTATSVREIARKLHAAQALHVEVNDATIDMEPGMYLPKALVYVWLVDTGTNQVLFPAQGTGRDDLTPGRPGPFVIAPSLHHKAAEADDPTLVPKLRRELAERIGRDVVRLFHSYDRDKPGEDFQD